VLRVAVEGAPVRTVWLTCCVDGVRFAAAMELGDAPGMVRLVALAFDVSASPLAPAAVAAVPEVLSRVGERPSAFAAV
jgi:hypothetical protein